MKNQPEKHAVGYLKMIVDRLDMVIDLLRREDELRTDYVRTPGALRILRRTNPRIMVKVRRNLLTGKKDWMREGKHFEYSVAALRDLRAKADAGKVTLLK